VVDDEFSKHEPGLVRVTMCSDNRVTFSVGKNAAVVPVTTCHSTGSLLEGMRFPAEIRPTQGNAYHKHVQRLIFPYSFRLGICKQITFDIEKVQHDFSYISPVLELKNLKA